MLLLFYDIKKILYSLDIILFNVDYYGTLNSKAISIFTLVIYSVVMKGDKVEQKSLQSVKTVAQFRQINSN